MAGFDWFWKAMGGKQGRNQKRSLAIVDQAAARVAKLNARSDEDLVARARVRLRTRQNFWPYYP